MAIYVPHSCYESRAPRGEAITRTPSECAVSLLIGKRNRDGGRGLKLRLYDADLQDIDLLAAVEEEIKKMNSDVK